MDVPFSPDHDGMPPPSEDYQRLHPDWNAKPRGEPYGKLTVFSVDDIDTAEPRDYLLKGIMSPGELSLWVGPPKCGKSFLMLYIAYRLSQGVSVFGRRVKPTRVLYTAAEGEGGIANRVKALRDRFGVSRNFRFIAQPADLLHEPGHKEDLKLAALGCQAQLIVLDTVNRVMAGGDENSSEDMGALILYMAELRQETKAHIAAVHHGTKASNGSTPRGHSSLTGADDVLVEITKQEDGNRIARIVHAKDDVDGYQFAFRLEPVDLGTDGDGDPVTTLIVQEAEMPAPTTPQPKLSDNEGIALRCLQKAINADAALVDVGDPRSQRSAVTVEQWRKWFYVEGKPGESQDTKKKAFSRAVDALQCKGRIGCENDYVWIIK